MHASFSIPLRCLRASRARLCGKTCGFRVGGGKRDPRARGGRQTGVEDVVGCCGRGRRREGGNLWEEIEIAGFRRNAGPVGRDRIARIRDVACSSAKINRIFRDKCLPTCFQMVSSVPCRLPGGPCTLPRPAGPWNLPTKGEDTPSPRSRSPHRTSALLSRHTAN